MAMHCISKVKNIYIYYFILCSHWWLDFFFFFFLLLPHFYSLLLSPLNWSSHSSFLPVARFNYSTRHRPKPLPNTDHADWSLRPPPLSLCYLIFLVLYLSIFLHLKHQDPWSPMLSFDFVAMIDKTTLSPWLGFMLMGSIFILMNGYWFCWWLMNGVCWLLMNGGWVSLISWWLLANLMVDDGFYFYFDERVLILLMVDEWGLDRKSVV